MRRTLLFILLAVLAASCSDDDEPWMPSPGRKAASPDSVLRVLQKDSLRILDIGSSYTEDGVAFLRQVAAANHADVSTVRLYCAIRGAGTFKSWFDCYYDRDNVAYYVDNVLGEDNVDATRRDGRAGDGSVFRELLQQARWDVIVLHPISTSATNYDEWFLHGSGGYLGEFLSLLMNLQPQALFAFYVTHSYWSGYEENKEHSSLARWQLTVNALERLVQSGYCDIVFPYGTAIENLRRSSLNNEYDLTRDGTHLEYGLARYTAACCYYETFLAPRYGESVMGQKFHWDGSSYESPYPVINIDDTTAAVAQKAAALAVADWWHCYNPESSLKLPLTP